MKESNDTPMHSHIQESGVEPELLGKVLANNEMDNRQYDETTKAIVRALLESIDPHELIVKKALSLDEEVLSTVTVHYVAESADLLAECLQEAVAYVDFREEC